MADVSTAETTPNTESKAQREARLRRERRNAKLQAGGSERLSKISSVSGRPAAAQAELARTPSTPQDNTSSTRQQAGGKNSSTVNSDDPAEVDISQMFRSPPQATNETGQQDLFQQMLRTNGDETSGGQGGSTEQMQDDPMMRMMQQMLGTMGGDMQSGGTTEPRTRASPGMFDTALGGSQEGDWGSVDNLWRIVHALFSFLLGLYAVSTLSFSGSFLSRSEYVTDPIGPRLFWMFATAELGLQTTRYFVDRGRLPPDSITGKIAAFLPEPYSGYIKVLSRYSIIYTTVVSDALVVVFILGAVAWWKESTNS